MSCCCPSCHTNLGGNQFTEICCKCVPKRICVAVYPPDGECPACSANEDDPDGVMTRLFLPLVCEDRLGKWSGSFSCNSTSIDLMFYFERDAEGICWYVLESTAMGYVTSPYDTRLKVRLGGEYGDHDTGREQCMTPDFDFTVTIAGCGDALIHVGPADMVVSAKVPPFEAGRDECWCDCVNLKVTLDGVSQIVEACWDEELPGWQATFDGVDTYEHTVTVYMDSAPGYPTLLRAESDLGDGEATAPICDCWRGMVAEWDLYGSGARLQIACIPPICLDCKCRCRCLCLIYSDTNGATSVSRICWDEYQENWNTVIGDATIAISTICNGRTGETKLALSASNATTEIEAVAITCPEITGSWGYGIGDDATATVSVQCDNCGTCSNLIQVPCCPDPMPLILYATVSGSRECLLLVEDPPVITPCSDTEIPLAYTANAPLGPPLWQGQAVLGCPDWPAGCYLKLTLECAEEIGVRDIELIGDCPDLSVNTQDTEGSPSDWWVVPGGTCSPVSFTINNVRVTLPPSVDCPSGGVYILTIVITE